MDWRLGDQSSIPGTGKRLFPLTSVSGPALGLTQPLVQWVPRALFLGVKRGQGMTLATHPHLVPRLWTQYTLYFLSSPLVPPQVCCGTALPFFLYMSPIAKSGGDRDAYRMLVENTPVKLAMKPFGMLGIRRQWNWVRIMYNGGLCDRVFNLQVLLPVN
jgi:hypothetical protein